MVAFVNDQVAIIRDHTFCIDRISQQQRMVDNDDMGMLRLCTDAVKRALVFPAERAGIRAAALVFG